CAAACPGEVRHQDRRDGREEIGRATCTPSSATCAAASQRRCCRPLPRTPGRSARVARGAAPFETDGPTNRVARVRRLSESAQLLGVPVACSPPCRRVRLDRATYFTFFAVGTLG